MGSGGDAVAALNAHAIAMGWGLRCYEALDFAQPELNALGKVWREKADATGRPSRADFGARTMKTWLPNLFIVERVEAGARRYRVRLSGTGLSRLFGESTGRFLDEALPEPFPERWTMACDTVLAGNAPLRFVCRCQTPAANRLDGESFAAPLANANAPSTTILGATYFTHRQELRAAG